MFAIIIERDGQYPKWFAGFSSNGKIRTVPYDNVRERVVFATKSGAERNYNRLMDTYLEGVEIVPIIENLQLIKKQN